ncbi:MAG: tRNA (adenosine(37)-N6)-threonylcarbamoyltransferase complex dimerization subunit type 1 TsaB [Bacilli bacterium]|nr:tRNA (adenosine(37)-N6)-threonylcarbamoyltransferase complex dimerization subunit type 1 TsaB [Bacilli bacterium]
MKKYYLILDSSDTTLIVGLKDDKKLIYSICKECPQMHSKVEIHFINEVLKLNKLNFSDLNGIIITTGPGSFVGIRISLTIAKIFSFVLKIPIYSISTLRANSIIGEKNIVLLDAKGDRSYMAIFDENNNYLLEDSLLNNREVKKYINKKSVNFIKIVCKSNYLKLKNKNLILTKNNFLKNVDFFISSK